MEQQQEPTGSPRGDLWTVILFALLIGLGLAVVALGIVLATSWPHNYTVLALGILAVVVPASIYPLVAAAQRSPGEGQESLELLRSINERLLLSDQAKRVSYREQDRAKLRDAIVEDLRKEDYEAALVLVDDMAEVFGYREEAEQFRAQILDARQKHHDQQVAQAIGQIEQICSEYHWEDAHRAVERLMRLFPDSPAVRGLTNRVDQAKEDRKLELERQFLRAAESGEADAAMELLKELDRYLTPAEAEPFVETARGVMGQMRENLGVQFKLAVRDRDWIAALNTGEAIVREFPNAKMADEVRGMLDLLRERAAGQRAADHGRVG